MWLAACGLLLREKHVASASESATTNDNSQTKAAGARALTAATARRNEAAAQHVNAVADRRLRSAILGSAARRIGDDFARGTVVYYYRAHPPLSEKRYSGYRRWQGPARSH